MITIQIEPADNGVIKFLIDDNVNGGGEEFTSRVVYEFEGPVKRANQVQFLKDLVIDLGLATGSDLDKDKLKQMIKETFIEAQDSDVVAE